MSSSSLLRFLELQSDDPALARVVGRVKEIFRALFQKQIIDGQILSSISLLSASPNRIPHKLGRKVNGYIIVRSSALSTFSDSGSDESFLTLNCSANTTVDIWVF